MRVDEMEVYIASPSYLTALELHTALESVQELELKVGSLVIAHVLDFPCLHVLRKSGIATHRANGGGGGECRAAQGAHRKRTRCRGVH